MKPQQLQQNQDKQLTTEDFDPRFNKQWNDNIVQQKRGPKNNQYDYYYPIGYFGYALNVINKYGVNQKWISKDGNDGEWRILYYGAMSDDQQQKLLNFENQICLLTYQPVGKGVFLFDKVQALENFISTIQVGNKEFVQLFQVRVNPKALKQSSEMNKLNCFMVNDSKAIRPYRILLQQSLS